MQKLWVIHPFLFAIFPILFLFAYNIAEVPAIDIVLPVVVTISGTIILFFTLRIITKNYNKSAIVTSYFWTLLFAYGYIEALILRLGWGKFVGDHGVVLSLILWALIFIIGAFLVMKSRSNFVILTKFLNVTAIMLVVISLVNIGIYEISNNLQQDEKNKERNSLVFENSDNAPDIYYIILDSYTRSDTLMEVHNYDNSQFIDYLSNKGFYVAPKSKSNYDFSGLSLASSLNMRYLAQEEAEDPKVLHKMIFNSEVSQFLKSRGYRYIFVVSSYFFSKGVTKYADAYVPSRGIFGGTMLTTSDFTVSLIEMTPLEPFVLYYFNRYARNGILYAFDKLADMPDINARKFILAHILVPHWPYVFDRDGNPPKGEGTYLDQLIFTNKKVEVLVDEILSKSDVAPIIILQADHGVAGEFRHNILNAYYLPGKDNQVLYETITPVNSFRLIFNLYFEMDYELLKDESYFSSSP